MGLRKYEVDAGQMVSVAFEARWASFIESLTERRLVPVVGSGISSGLAPMATGLIDTLADLIPETFFGSSDDEQSMAKLAEFAIQFKGAWAVCEALEIASWADDRTIRPTQTHHYLAMLAADGWIDEIITTNYDRGIEAAWTKLGLSQKHLAVISQANELHRSRPQAAGLSLYKINGCAKRLFDANRKATKEAKPQPTEAQKTAADQILLTDTQLLGFANAQARRWVHDLLRDRTRSRSLVFSGFGSDEPQIWHVVRLILEELAVLAQAENPGNSTPRIWLANYGNKLPFHLLTALLDEAKLRKSEPLAQQILGRFNGFDNVFSANDSFCLGVRQGFDPAACWRKVWPDAPNVNHETKDFWCRVWRGLDAGEFWRKAWLDALKAGLKQSPVVDHYIQAALSRRPARYEEVIYQRQWAKIVDAAFERIPLWDTKHPAPGVAWAGRYISFSSEPAYWVTAVLIAFANQDDEKYEGIQIDEAPSLLLHSQRQSPLRSVATINPHVQVQSSTGAERSTQLTIHVDLLESLAPNLKFEETRSAVHHLLHQTTLHQARQQVHRRRTARRIPQGSNQ